MRVDYSWSDAAISQGMPAATRNWKRQEDSPLDSSEGVQACSVLGLRFLANKRINFCCCKPPILWKFVIVALGY